MFSNITCSSVCVLVPHWYSDVFCRQILHSSRRAYSKTSRGQGMCGAELGRARGSGAGTGWTGECLHVWWGTGQGDPLHPNAAGSCGLRCFAQTGPRPGLAKLRLCSWLWITPLDCLAPRFPVMLTEMVFICPVVWWH